MESCIGYVKLLNNDNYLDYDDWRLPTVIELLSLIDYSLNHLGLPDGHPFLNVNGGYWSSTTWERFMGMGINVFLKEYRVHANTNQAPGHLEGFNKDLDIYSPAYYMIYVLPVRNYENAGMIDSAWSVSLINGRSSARPKNAETYVWPVRTDNNSLPSGSIQGSIDEIGITGAGVSITIQGPVNAWTKTDATGHYEFSHLPNVNGYAVGDNRTILKYSLLEGAPEGSDILGFGVSQQVGHTSIDLQNLTIYAEVNPEADLTSLIPELFLSAGASCDPPSGQSQDFTNPVSYTVTSADGAITQIWTVTVDYFTSMEEGEKFLMNDGILLYPNPTIGI